MSEIPNVAEEYNYFEKLFEKAEKEQIGELYKKELYIMSEDLENNKSKSKLKLMHDALLKKLFCEDFNEYTPKNELEKQVNPNYPPKNEQNNIININNNNKNATKEDLLDKELSEELDYLKTISRLNYLTFSPFALDYFEKINNLSNSSLKNNPKNNEINQNDKDNNNNNNNLNIDINLNNLKENKDEEEKEKKLMDLLDFDYNSFEINNDLLFNICQGFIDPSKLKESNIKIPTQEQLKEVSNNEDSSDSSKNDEYDIYEYDEELEQDVIDRTMNFVHKYENNIMLKGAIIRFKDELRNLPPKCKNKVKNLFYRKWENEFIKLEKSNERFQKKRKEDVKKKEFRKQRKYLNELKKEKSKEIEKYTGYSDELIDELKKLQKDAMIKSGNKETEKEDKNKKRRKKRFNKTVSKEKDEIVKSNKKFYCSGFNIYKEIISNKHRNISEKK